MKRERDTPGASKIDPKIDRMWRRWMRFYDFVVLTYMSTSFLHILQPAVMAGGVEFGDALVADVNSDLRILYAYILIRIATEALFLLLRSLVGREFKIFGIHFMVVDPGAEETRIHVPEGEIEGGL